MIHLRRLRFTRVSIPCGWPLQLGYLHLGNNKLKGIICLTGGVHEYGKLSGSELYKEIEKIANDLPNHLPAKDVSITLASSLHDFKSDTLAEAYSDLEKQGMLNPVGIAALTDIPFVKDQLIKEKYPMRKVPRLVKYATGYYYLRKLSRSERKEFLKELKLHHRGHFSTQEWLMTTFDDLEGFIACSFNWGGSVKGAEYWIKISDRARWWNLPLNPFNHNLNL